MPAERPMVDRVAEEGGEFEIIRRLRERWGPLARGIGDDAAVLRPPRGEQIVVSTDAVVERVHFRREWLTLQQIGYRAVTGALSDLAAMAASPLGVLVAIQLPPDRVGDVDDLADGIGDALRAAETVIVGGNIARGDSLALTTTVIGSVYSPLTRGGARPGDFLYVTGALGGQRAALRVLETGGGAQPEQHLMARFAGPKARIAEARWLAARGATAAIDISDGLAADAGHMAAASDSVLEIQVDRVPIFAGATEEDALASGEEYELLLATRTPVPEGEFAGEFGIPLTAIGRVESGSAEVRLLRDGSRVAAPPGHDHFSR